MSGGKAPKEVGDFGKLIQHALPGVGLPPRVLPRGDDDDGAYAYRPYSAAKEVRGVLAHFPQPWRGMQGAVLWCPDHAAHRLRKFDRGAGGVTFGSRGLSLLEVVTDDVGRLLAGDGPLTLTVTDAYVWDGTNLAGAALPDRLAHVALTDAGPSRPPPVSLRPCAYTQAPPASGAWARLPMHGGVAPTETVDPETCVVRAVCRRDGEACVLGGGSLVPFVLAGAPSGREGQHALFEFVGASGEWRCLDGAACVGPAMGVAEAVARLARVAI